MRIINRLKFKFKRFKRGSQIISYYSQNRDAIEDYDNIMYGFSYLCSFIHERKYLAAQISVRENKHAGHCSTIAFRGEHFLGRTREFLE